MPRILHIAKRPTLVRVPEDIYELLIRLSAAETLRRQETVSVPALIVEIVSEKLKAKKCTI
jgi:hypothetical protein